MRWYAGTSGYSYKEWKGPFYPDDLPADRMLTWYAARLPAVEINNTFYRMPRSSVLEAWADAVPDGFRFAIKAPRRITHQQRLKDAAEPTRYLVDRLGALGDKLGAVLFQLPPNLRAERDRLEAFLDLLPAGLPAAFEFRHPSWHEPEILDALESRAMSLCVADDESGSAAESIRACNWLYLRLRRPDYDEAALTDWIRRGETSHAERGFVFFKHEDAAAGPALATRFLELTAPRARRAPRAAPPRQRPAAASGRDRA
jgi:uncharacterized protein YecE (DUF72 family)